MRGGVHTAAIRIRIQTCIMEDLSTNISSFGAGGLQVLRGCIMLCEDAPCVGVCRRQSHVDRHGAKFLGRPSRQGSTPLHECGAHPEHTHHPDKGAHLYMDSGAHPEHTPSRQGGTSLHGCGRAPEAHTPSRQGGTPLHGCGRAPEAHMPSRQGGTPLHGCRRAPGAHTPSRHGNTPLHGCEPRVRVPHSLRQYEYVCLMVGINFFLIGHR